MRTWTLKQFPPTAASSRERVVIGPTLDDGDEVEVVELAPVMNLVSKLLARFETMDAGDYATTDLARDFLTAHNRRSGASGER